MPSIVFEWFEPVDSDYSLSQTLEWFKDSYGEIVIFVRRLAWVPSNYPCRMDGGATFDADHILVESSDDPQVLCGCWIDFEDLRAMFTLIEFSTVDFEVYRLEDMCLLGSLGYFECLVRLWVSRPQLTDRALQSLAAIRVSGCSETTDRMQYLVFTSEVGYGVRTSLNIEGLLLAHTIPLKSVRSVLSTRSQWPTDELLELNEVLDCAVSRYKLKALSLDWFRKDKLGFLSNIYEIEPLEDLHDDFRAPWGSLFFFDESWILRLWATKTQNEAKWRINLLSCSSLTVEIERAPYVDVRTALSFSSQLAGEPNRDHHRLNDYFDVRLRRPGHRHHVS